MQLKEFLLLLFGAIIGWLLQRLTDILTAPNFKIDIGTSPIFQPPTAKDHYKFMNVSVINVKRGILSFFISSNTATNARVWLSFLDPETKAELLKINGRWTTTKEPVDYHGGVNIGDALLVSRETIPPDESTEISIAIKKQGMDECYAFNNESYLYSWEKPDFQLDQKRYLLKVKIAAEGKEWVRNFILLNLGKSLKNFRLVRI
ncbi:MAG: hypothetical protein HYW86_03905 [Candidatus Roizmanbacteria bacterium]|nr:MAG: hypothetical protein HYW86_03905 [Candidatus Roizmanbacteria bacterium]